MLRFASLSVYLLLPMVCCLNLREHEMEQELEFPELEEIVRLPDLNDIDDLAQPMDTDGFSWTASSLVPVDGVQELVRSERGNGVPYLDSNVQRCKALFFLEFTPEDFSVSNVIKEYRRYFIEWMQLEMNDQTFQQVKQCVREIVFEVFENTSVLLLNRRIALAIANLGDPTPNQNPTWQTCYKKMNIALPRRYYEQAMNQAELEQFIRELSFTVLEQHVLIDYFYQNAISTQAWEKCYYFLQRELVPYSWVVPTNVADIKNYLTARFSGRGCKNVYNIRVDVKLLHKNMKTSQMNTYLNAHYSYMSNLLTKLSEAGLNEHWLNGFVAELHTCYSKLLVQFQS